MSRNSRYNSSDAAQRTRADSGHSAFDSVAADRLMAQGGEYVQLSVHEISSSPYQARRVFQQIEELAASVEGTGELEGVGVLEPILVRRLADGTVQLIDGERRVLACRLIAERSPAKDFKLPARVFVVGDRVAELMGQTANLHQAPRPIEVALGYASLRTAMRKESGPRAGSLRTIAGIGWHEKTEIGEYLRIAERVLAKEVLEPAGLLTAAGEPDYALLCQLGKPELDKVADVREPAARATALRDRVAMLTATRPPRRPREVVAPARSPEERRAEITTGKGFAVKSRTPAQMLDPTTAAAMVRDELAPAMLALAERAHWGPGRDGFYAEVVTEHVIIVVPNEPEALTLPQLERLASLLGELRGRVGGALRHRRKKAKDRQPRAA
jgi:hypothetical protein